MRINPLIVSLAICAAALAVVPLIGNAQFAPTGGGPPGSAGTPGSIFYMIGTPPTPGLGAVTDVAVDTTTANAYQRDGVGWQGPLMNIRGPQGVAGNTGAQGATGATGSQGLQGNTGAQGPQGIQGVTGAAGSAGAAGTNGSNGTNGTNGTIFQSATATTDTAGLYAWTYPTPYAGGIVPQCWGQAQGPNPAGGVLVNIQNEGAATNTARSFRVTKTNASVVALIGLTILSIPASVGATTIDVFCKAP